MLVTPLRVIWRRRTLERSCRWTRAKLEQHQQQRLADLRRFAREHSPFYARFHHGLENEPLDRLPVLTKAIMMERFDELVTDRSVRLADAEAFLRRNPGNEMFLDRYVVLATSGSTGRRGVFLFDRDEWLTALALILRPFVWSGIVRSWTWPPRTATIASTTPWHYSARVSAALKTRLFPTLRMDVAEPLPTIVGRLNDWQPDVLASYPSAIKQLAEEAIAGRLHIQPRSVGTSAEVLTASTRERVLQAWGIRMFDTYGATEYAPIAAECAFGRKHLLEDGAMIEIVDDRGQRVPPGVRGDRLLLTVFDRHTQPLIRYEISDMVRPLEGNCQCGRPFALIESIEGRLEDVLYFQRHDGGAGAVVVHPNVFHRVLEEIPASGWQVQQEADGLLISLTGLQDASICNQLASTMRGVLEDKGAAVVSIRVCSVEALERGPTGKAPLIVRKDLQERI
jgi:putative adenylate-forming enzyme